MENIEVKIVKSKTYLTRKYFKNGNNTVHQSTFFGPYVDRINGKNVVGLGEVLKLVDYVYERDKTLLNIEDKVIGILQCKIVTRFNKRHDEDDKIFEDFSFCGCECQNCIKNR